MLCFVALRCCGGPRDPTQHVHLSFYLLSHLFPSPPLLPLLLLTAFSAMEPRQPSTGPHKKSSGKGKARKEAAAGAVYEDGDEEDGDATPPGGPRTDEEKKRRSMPPSSSAAAGGSKRGSGSGGAAGPCCQAEKCAADLTEAKRYYRRHKVCEAHSKAAAVVVAGLRQRFCQQCSRFHELSEFDDSKRSCRRRLAGHNERRRKSSSDGNPDGRIQMSDSTHSHSLQR